MKLPWVKWFPTDWLAEAELAKTSLAARGLWIEVLNVMFNSDTFALTGTPTELARVLRCSVAEFNTALEDLSRTGTACHSARNGVVTLVSRRLERVHKMRSLANLRQQRFREHIACNAKVPSASASASASGDRGAGERGVGTRFVPPSIDSMKLHGAKIGLPDSEVEKCFYYYQSNGWRVGRNPMKCWRSAMINWRKNWQANGMPGLRGQPQQQGTILDKEIAAVQRALK